MCNWLGALDGALRRTVVVVVALALIGSGAQPGGVSATSSVRGDWIGAGPFDTALARAINFREFVGFSTDREFVTASLVDSTAFPDLSWGLPLTTDEATEMARRLEVQLAVDSVIEELGAMPTSAGVYMDQHAAGEPVFLTTEEPQQFRARIAARVPLEISYRIERARFTRWELEEVRRQIIEDRPELRMGGIEIHSVGILVPENRVLVGVVGAGPDAAAVLNEKYGGSVAVREDPVRELDSCGRTNCPPLKGGILIYRTTSTGWECTAGFIVKLQGTSTLRVLTAGHCIEKSGGLGLGWSHHGSQFGTAQTETWGVGSNADAGLMSLSTLPGPNNLVLASSGSDVRAITSWRPNSQQNFGDSACRSAAKSGWICGFIVAEDLSLDVDGKTIDHQWEVNFDAIPGDSGASMISGYTALGIHSDSTAASPPGGLGWYSPIEWVLTKLDGYGTPIVLCTSSGC